MFRGITLFLLLKLAAMTMGSASPRRLQKRVLSEGPTRDFQDLTLETATVVVSQASDKVFGLDDGALRIAFALSRLLRRGPRIPNDLVESVKNTREAINKRDLHEDDKRGVVQSSLLESSGRSIGESRLSTASFLGKVDKSVVYGTPEVDERHVPTTSYSVVSKTHSSKAKESITEVSEKSDDHVSATQNHEEPSVRRRGKDAIKRLLSDFLSDRPFTFLSPKVRSRIAAVFVGLGILSSLYTISAIIISGFIAQ